nr:MAG TPA_asm: hypothetical protein [Caudoviricetes sp.]
MCPLLTSTVLSVLSNSYFCLSNTALTVRM